VGAALRLLAPQDFLFRQDEAEHFALSLDLSAAGEWPMHAWPSSAGVPNGPMFLWLLLTLARFTGDPRVATAVIILLNVGALAMAVPLMRRLLPGRGEATMAVALLATNPVAIWFSRKLWDPCLLAIFTVPALLITTRVLERPRTRSLVLLPMLLAAAALTHQSAAFFAVAVAGALSVDTRKMARLPLLVGVGLAVAMVYPYASFLVGYVAEHGFGGGSQSALPDIDVLTNVFLDATGHNLFQSAGREAGRLLVWPVPPVGLLIHLAALPLYAYVLAGFAEAWRPRAPAPAGPLSARALRRLLVGVPAGLVLLYLAAFVRGVAHYFLVLMPLLTALIVLGDRRLRAVPRTGWRRLLLPLPALVVVHVVAWIHFQAFVSLRHGSDSYGLPYGDIVAACRDVDAAAGARGLPRDEPLVLQIDVPRDRGVIPAAYRFVLERRLGRRVEPAGEDRPAELVLRIAWPNPRRGRPWEVLEGSGT
jgi:4-amino-4-deoxy-L-arabinose transferase-like glycosyltransferase